MNPQKKRACICLTGDMSTDYRVHKTATSLIGMGFDVTCVLRNRSDYKKVHAAPYKTVYLNTIWEKGPLFYLTFNIRLAGWLLLHKTNVIVSIDLDTLPGCAIAAKTKRTPLVFDSHEYFPEVPELQHRPLVKKTWLWLERRFVPKINHGYTVCRSIADIYLSKYGTRFDVVRNLPSVVRNAPATPVVADKRFKIVYQGAINLGRGILETIAALPLLPDVLLVVVGDGDIILQVKEKVKTLGVDDQVVFVGKVPFSQLTGYTASADAGLCLLENLGLNYYYSLPNRIFDFAQAGIPILASNFPEIREVVGKLGTGVLVDDLAPETIANAINRLKNDQTAYQQMKANALKAGNELVWENELPVLEGIYRQFLS